ncbi:thiolase [Streptomyces umbrinus]|uniref:thiolase C-terminal domain-containing protein n=1 Tax=Streptomyces umbrinus TaxID=67370 RepID=UPI001674E6E6|nr:thiolase [Streptomyces umbrinus]GHB83054.1 thiolase [Streptomyces umbrinus]
MRPGSIAIVGAAETDRIGVLPDQSQLNLNIGAARNALRDAGLTPADIDGVASTGFSAGEVAEALGIHTRWVDTTSVGGCSYFLHVRHAAAAITAGMASAVLITHGESGRSRVGEAPLRFSASGPMGQFEMPYGTAGFATMFTVPALRFMKEFGVTHEQLAGVAAAQRKWAQPNERAFRRDPLTVEDVLASPMIAYPFHRAECCVVTDGGGALIVTSAERAADLKSRPVYILGTGESTAHTAVSQMEDFTSSRAFRESSADAFREAGVGTADIDHLMVYDAFAHVPLYGLQDLGFVKPGEAAAFVAEGNTEPGGSLPMNTNGGGLSYTHTGMYGMFAMQEAVRQVRGTAAVPVPDVELSFVQGVGGMFSTAASLVLARDRP